MSDPLKDSLRIGGPPAPHPNLLPDPDFREVFLVEDIPTATNARPKMVLVYDDDPPSLDSAMLRHGRYPGIRTQIQRVMAS